MENTEQNSLEEWYVPGESSLERISKAELKWFIDYKEKWGY